MVPCWTRVPHRASGQGKTHKGIGKRKSKNDVRTILGVLNCAAAASEWLHLESEYGKGEGEEERIGKDEKVAYVSLCNALLWS